ncbi:MAG: Omp28-related outer membrane protein [Paludibacteraceae bacterium]
MTTPDKLHISFLSLCLAVAFCITACQVIPENEQLLPVESSETEKTCLLIDFSAWKCVNCPNAAEEAHKLLEQYGDQLIVMEAHPAANGLTKPPTKYPEYDYTCPAADSLYIALGGTGTTPLPIGSVDMAAFDNGSGSGAYLKTPDQWGSMVYLSLMSDYGVDIHLNINEKKEIICQLNNRSDIEMACSLYMWLTEDNIVSAQYFPDSTTTNYLRNHLLRDAISAPNGEPLTLPAAEKVSVTKTYVLPEKVVPENCHIVAAVYANGEIIQAAQIAAEIEQ